MMRDRDFDDDIAYGYRPTLRSTVRPPPPPPDTDPSLLAPRDGSMASPPPPSFEELEHDGDDDDDDGVRWFSRFEIPSFPAPSSTAGFEATLAELDPDRTVRIPRMRPAGHPLLALSIVTLALAALIVIGSAYFYFGT
ncbi:MAG: hypothetical protein HOO96_27770 [Polyangiaceae bacterium]|nr:hypothetical protein [Polyangiaceae bacterium]